MSSLPSQISHNYPSWDFSIRFSLSLSLLCSLPSCGSGYKSIVRPVERDSHTQNQLRKANQQLRKPQTNQFKKTLQTTERRNLKTMSSGRQGQVQQTQGQGGQPGQQGAGLPQGQFQAGQQGLKAGFKYAEYGTDFNMNTGDNIPASFVTFSNSFFQTRPLTLLFSFLLLFSSLPVGLGTWQIEPSKVGEILRRVNIKCQLPSDHLHLYCKRLLSLAIVTSIALPNVRLSLSLGHNQFSQLITPVQLAINGR